jgi:magnesium-transporting ATPase (P-type)
MHKFKKNISLLLVILAYLLFNLRYTAESFSSSLQSTLIQLLTTAPFVVGLTILVVTFMQRSTGERLPWDRIIRIYCTLGIVIGFFYGLNEYWLSAQ